MKKPFKFSLLMLVVLIFSSSNIQDAHSEENNKSATILFTHDLHDHLYPFDSLKNNLSFSNVRYSILSTAIKNETSIDPELILVDAGDFSMGTLFQTIFTSSSPELRIMGKLGYDVTTFGNHEFDFRDEGLANSLVAAKDSGDNLPQIVSSNISFPLNGQGELKPSLKKLKSSMDDYGVKDYTVIDRNGIKIGVFGLLGKDASSSAPMSELFFEDAISKSKEIVSTLKEKEKVDLIICLSHSGTWNKKSKSEDEILAKEVPEIDVIASGHTHTSLEKPIIVGNTIIGSVGQYGKNLGKLNITQNSNKRWDLNTYKLQKINGSLDMDSEISNNIDSFRDIVQMEYLDNFNMTFDDVIAHTPFNITKPEVLGSFISDSYQYAVKKAEGIDYEPVAVTIAPYGVIRDSFIKGDITTSEVFNVSPLGIGPDKISGYPLISVYLTGKELKTMAEVDASIDMAQLHMSGLNYTSNSNRLIFDKVTDVHLSSSDGTESIIEDEKLYRIVTGLYSAQMLSVVGDKSFGLLSIIPKSKDGEIITDFESHIIYDGDHELKEWVAIGEYLKSFPKENNVSQIPEYYNNLQSRKTVIDDNGIYSKLKNPNNIWLMVYGVFVLIITFISSLIIFFIKKKRRKLEA